MARWRDGGSVSDRRIFRDVDWAALGAQVDLLFPMKFPPGMMRNGTRYEAKGRWYDGNLVRWDNGVLQPIGGWSPLTNGTLTEPARGAVAWRRSDSNTLRFVFGSASYLWILDGANTSHFAPGPYTGGSSDTVWHLDTFGDLVAAVATTDGHIYMLDYSVGDVTLGTYGTLSSVTGKALVVTPERFLFILGADGDARKVRWPDQEAYDFTVLATATNQVGDFALTTPGALQCGLRGRGETLLFTDHDLWAARYIGGQLVYSFTKVGAECGIIGSKAATTMDSRAIWMGTNSFFTYDGFVQPLPCEVADYVFSNVNRSYTHKICCTPIAAHREVVWSYPSSGSSENDSYVTLHEDGHWSLGALPRTCGIGAGPHPYPIMCGANGIVYEHEKGTSYLNAAGSQMTPFVESGPVEMGNGDNVMMATKLIPDDKTAGDVTATFFGAFYPDDAETTYGPYTLAKKTDVRFTARQVRMRITQVNASWRVGSPRLDLIGMGRR